MALRARPIDQANWQEALALSVRPEQQAFVPSVAVSLAKAYIRPEGLSYDPFGIYVDDTLVGFYSYIHDPRLESTCFLGGLIIRKEDQGRGHGRAAILDFLDNIRRHHPNTTTVDITVHPANTAALKLVESIGFVDTGTVIEGERVYSLEVAAATPEALAS